MATSLDYFLQNVLTQDTRKRMQTHGELVTYLQDSTNSVHCDEMEKFVDGLSSWVSSSNFKISVNGLEVLSLLIDRIGEDFRPHITTVLPAAVDRLGDNKDQVREAAQDVLHKLMDPCSSPQFVFERMMGAFTHKLWRVREEVCICLQKTLNHSGAKSLSLSKIVPSICKLLEDQSGQVREAAVNTLVEIYRHVGERVRSDLAKKDINPSKQTVLFARMDEVRNMGNMMPSADAPRDDVDFAKPIAPAKTAKRGSSATTRKSGISSKPSSAVTSKRKQRPPTASGSTGAVDEDSFIRLFEEVPKVHIFSGRELVDHMNKINTMLSDPSNAWEKRVESLKAMRSLLIAGALDYDEFYPNLRQLEASFQTSVKDLRSQIVREACISISYMSQQIGNKFDRFAEALLPNLINQIPNSAKIMSTSGTVTIRFLIQHTHAPRMIPIITNNLSSKSNVIRRECSEFLDQLLHTWPTHTLERHIAILQEAIKKGLGDADQDARAHSRKAFWGFADHFKEQADSLLNSLEPNKQKMLQGELSNSSSNNSLNSGNVPSRTGSMNKGKPRTRSISTERTVSRDLYGRTLGSAGTARRSTTAQAHPSTTTSRTASSSSPRTDTTDGGLVRSSSAVDLTPGSGSKSTTTGSRIPSNNYNSLRQSRSTVDLSSGSGYGSRIPKPAWTPHSTTRPKKTFSGSSSLTPDRSRPRSRIGISQSQPSSRSGSPSSRLSYITHTQQTPQTTGRPRRKSGIPRSQGASREASPSRLYGRERKLSGSGLRQLGGAQRLPQTKVIAQRVLQPGQDSEIALHEALQRLPSKKRFDRYESDDEASETSSVCSERSYSSYGRASEDIQDILASLGSASWADRKEGLLALQNMIRSSRVLTRIELKKITEIFTRMFHDPHGKVFSMFLETLVDLVAIHRTELHDWLYVLLTRLLNKTGADLLGSVHAKVQRALEAIRDSFAFDHQFNTITRFIIDQTQTPNLKIKVKVGLLNYMHGLILMMDPGDFVNSSDTRLAVSRIITWTTEPKSVDVRKAAQAVLIALFNLNTPEFSMMLSVLPKTFQEGATKILHNHLRNSSTEAEPLSPRNVTSPTTTPSYRYKPSPRSNVDELETENMNPEEIYNSIKKTSADIQNLSKLDSSFDDIKKERDSTSQDSGIQSSMHDVRSESPDFKTRVEMLDSPRAGRRQQYNPSYYQDDNLNGYNRAALAEAVFDVDHELFNEDLPNDDGDLVTEILTELSNHNERQEERKNAMLQLIKMTREGTLGIWEEHFKTILLLLLETLGDIDGHIRALSLRVLKEILKYQPSRFKDYAELTILKILEAHKDPTKEINPFLPHDSTVSEDVMVTRAAEECAGTLANSIPPEQCVRVLNPIIQTAEFPVNLAAIKMQTKVVEIMASESMVRMLPDMIPGLIKGYDNNESSVRKASVFCLVAVYVAVGEELRPYLTDLNGSKMKLLNLYIKRATSQHRAGDSSAATSKTTSPASVTDLV